MLRRAFLSGVSAAAALALARRASAQAIARMPRIAIVTPTVKPEDIARGSTIPAYRAYFAELERLGYMEGKNLVVERYSAFGRTDQHQEIARAAVASGPDLIFTYSGPIALLLKSVTTTIPIVVTSSDPVASGLTTNLARPEANITGLATEVGLEVWGKRFQFLNEVSRKLANARLLVTDIDAGSGRLIGPVLQQIARRSGIALELSGLGNRADAGAYDRAFAAMADERADGLIVSDASEHVANRALIVQLAARYRIPAIYPFREFALAGGLLSYGVDLADIARRLAGMTADILKGKKIAEIPYAQPTKFELLINRTTATSLGLEFPASLTAIADEVIE